MSSDAHLMSNVDQAFTCVRPKRYQNGMFVKNVWREKLFSLVDIFKDFSFCSNPREGNWCRSSVR